MKLIIALVVFASALWASPIETGTLTLTGVNGQSVDGYDVSPYYATLGSAGLVVYCDDFLDSVSIGESWPVDVYAGYAVTGAMFSAADYPVLFWLAGQETVTNEIPTQGAMWAETDPTFPDSTAASVVLLAEAQADAGSVNLSSWDIMTPVGDVGQEFIVDSVTMTPEPGTLVLLMACAFVFVIFIKFAPGDHSRNSK